MNKLRLRVKIYGILGQLKFTWFLRVLVYFCYTLFKYMLLQFGFILYTVNIHLILCLYEPALERDGQYCSLFDFRLS